MAKTRIRISADLTVEEHKVPSGRELNVIAQRVSRSLHLTGVDGILDDRDIKESADNQFPQAHVHVLDMNDGEYCTQCILMAQQGFEDDE